MWGGKGYKPTHQGLQEPWAAWRHLQEAPTPKQGTWHPPPLISDPGPRARAARQRGEQPPGLCHLPAAREGPEAPAPAGQLLFQLPGPKGFATPKYTPRGLLHPKSAPHCPSPTTWQKKTLPPGSGIWHELPACPGPVTSLSGPQFPHLQIKQLIPRVTFSYKILNLKRKKTPQKEVGASATSSPSLVKRGNSFPWGPSCPAGGRGEASSPLGSWESRGEPTLPELRGTRGSSWFCQDNIGAAQP